MTRKKPMHKPYTVTELMSALDSYRDMNSSNDPVIVMVNNISYKEFRVSAQDHDPEPCLTCGHKLETERFFVIDLAT